MYSSITTFYTSPHEVTGWAHACNPDQYGCYRIDFESFDPKNDAAFMALLREVGPVVESEVAKAAAAESSSLRRDELAGMNLKRALVKKYEDKEGRVRYRLRFKVDSKRHTPKVLGPDGQPLTKGLVGRGDVVRIQYRVSPYILKTTGTAGVTLELCNVMVVSKSQSGPSARQMVPLEWAPPDEHPPADPDARSDDSDAGQDLPF